MSSEAGAASPPASPRLPPLRSALKSPRSSVSFASAETPSFSSRPSSLQSGPSAIRIPSGDSNSLSVPRTISGSSGQSKGYERRVGFDTFEAAEDGSQGGGIGVSHLFDKLSPPSRAWLIPKSHVRRSNSLSRSKPSRRVIKGERPPGPFSSLPM
jgi:hypothetical protein